MRRGVVGLAVLAASLFLGVGWAGAATTLRAAPRPGFVVVPPHLTMMFVAFTANGWDLYFTGESPNRVKLELSDGPEGVTYELAGRVSADRVEANLGRLGRISVRFQPRKVFTYKRSGNCRGPATKRTEGKFVGTIEFHGELGYTKFSSPHINGERELEARRVCRRQRRPDRASASSFDSGGVVVAISQTPTEKTIFEATNVKQSFMQAPGWVYGASRTEEGGRIRVTRALDSEVEDDGTGPVIGGTVSPLGVLPEKFEVAPPPPFSGTGTFSRAAPGLPPQWTGSLGVKFPGTEFVPLTGEGFEPLLCRGEDTTCSELLVAPPA